MTLQGAGEGPEVAGDPGPPAASPGAPQERSGRYNIIYENRDFAIAKSQFSTNPMLKKGLTHYKE